MPKDPYAKLRALPRAERIDAVIADVESRRDRFRGENTHELAQLLGLDALQPDDEWDRSRVVLPVDLAQVARDSDEIESRWVFELEEHVSPERFLELEAASECTAREDFDVGLLSPFEERFIAGKVLDERMRDEAWYVPLAHASVDGSGGRSLRFEALIQDDGSCIDLLGPYDERDGKFLHVEGAEVESW